MCPMPAQRLRLKQALHSWDRHCDAEAPSRIVSAFSTGLTNRSFLIVTGDNFFVLRLHNLASSALGINRQNEELILSVLAKKNIAPAPIYFSACGGFSVLSYANGRVWTQRDFSSSFQRTELLQAIECYQQCDFSLPEFDYVRHLQCYWKRFCRAYPGDVRGLQHRWRVFLNRLILEQNICRGRVLVHHDLNPSNIIETKCGILILDWEYAGIGFKGVDEASVLSGGNKTHAVSLQKKRSFISELLFWLTRLWCP